MFGNTLVRIAAVAGLIWLGAASQTGAQQSTQAAAATPATASSGRPSTIQLKQNALKQQQAALAREATEVSRCLSISSQTQVLRDPEGNINQVPEIDLVNCARRLAALRRQQARLARSAQQLAQDAQAQANFVQRELEEARRQARLRAFSNTNP